MNGLGSTEATFWREGREGPEQRFHRPKTPFSKHCASERGIRILCARKAQVPKATWRASSGTGGLLRDETPRYSKLPVFKLGSAGAPRPLALADQEIPGPANRDPDSRSRPTRESGIPCFPAKSGIGDSLPDSRQKNREIGGIGNPISSG